MHAYVRRKRCTRAARILCMDYEVNEGELVAIARFEQFWYPCPA